MARKQRVFSVEWIYQHRLRPWKHASGNARRVSLHPRRRPAEREFCQTRKSITKKKIGAAHCQHRFFFITLRGAASYDTTATARISKDNDVKMSPKVNKAAGNAVTKNIILGAFDSSTVPRPVQRGAARQSYDSGGEGLSAGEASARQ